jgi:cytochrome c oxidase subunit 2
LSATRRAKTLDYKGFASAARARFGCACWERPVEYARRFEGIPRMSNATHQSIARIGAVLASLAVAGIAQADWALNMTEGVTEVSRSVHALHMLIFWVCVAIAVVVFGAMIWSIVNHRKSKGVKPATFHDSLEVEIAWTIIPFLILIGMAIPSAQVLIGMEDFRNSDVSIKVTGYQWKWQYEYLGQGVSFFSTLDRMHNEARQVRSGVDVMQIHDYLLNVDNPLIVPTGKKVRLLLTSNDVIHAWWVPALGGKKDAIPGYVQEMWFKIDADKPGLYRGQCAELCGRDHGFMPIVVKAVSAAEYDAWLADQKGPAVAATPAAPVTMSKEDQFAAGEKAYNGTCAACHGADGGGNAAMGVKPLKGSPIAKGALAPHLALVLNGKPNTIMSPWKQLSDAELAAIITYERNAWGNATGDVVQAADVAAARGK